MVKSTSTADALSVQVVFALPQHQTVLELNVPAGTTIAGAIAQAGLESELAGLATRDGTVGIFGQPRRLLDEVRAGDRIEIYRPLAIDPKEARRLRAATQKNR